MVGGAAGARVPVLRAGGECESLEQLDPGPAPTPRVDGDPSHEGNLFETLRARCACHRASDG